MTKFKTIARTAYDCKRDGPSAFASFWFDLDYARARGRFQPDEYEALVKHLKEKGLGPPPMPKEVSVP